MIHVIYFFTHIFCICRFRKSYKIQNHLTLTKDSCHFTLVVSVSFLKENSFWSVALVVEI